MPEIRDFIVIETRTVKVSANSAPDAIRLADAAFTYGQNSDSGIKAPHSPTGIWGNTTSRIKQVALEVKDVRHG